jgi:hypothetical protein
MRSYLVPLFVTLLTVACGNVSKNSDGTCSDAFIADYNLVELRTRGSHVHPATAPFKEVHDSAKQACDRFFSRHADVSCGTNKRTTDRQEDLVSKSLKAQCDAIEQKSNSLK